MFGDKFYGAVEVEMLAEANRIITEVFTDWNEVASQPRANHGLRTAFTTLLRRRPALQPPSAGFHQEANPCVEC